MTSSVRPTLLDQCSKNEHDSHMIIFSTPFNYSKLCKWHILCPKGVHLHAHQPERYRTSKISYKFLNNRRYIYLHVELQYLAIEKKQFKIKKEEIVFGWFVKSDIYHIQEHMSTILKWWRHQKLRHQNVCSKNEHWSNMG